MVTSVSVLHDLKVGLGLPKLCFVVQMMAHCFIFSVVPYPLTNYLNVY